MYFIREGSSVNQSISPTTSEHHAEAAVLGLLDATTISKDIKQEV